ncbi:xanthine phosphoribosyltransferase [Gemelliphila palaticanis]|uniref:Xanthine phosphoribosyltransferase n=1 Tax=Gemelliphila palaticanis TaxID=81950 RepID=A0ABX2SXL3_9BACL|nr:xanthine phosphoribosyltransferase [Gemella palaticanis]MBF0715067.1 xanthine phosphoribosyltransferase [Gemella palaticanis]NYS46997.1 xanthine phosphoribosyltransferase [Gemella palaticanis]
MKLLEQMVVNDGKVYSNNVLKVDSFINHQIDPKLMLEMAKTFYEQFKNDNITKILTIEASGIAPAILVANLFNVPMVFAKKSVPSTLTRDSFYEAQVYSYTKNVTNNIIVSKDFLNKEDKVLIIDDFLANGQAVLGLSDLIDKAGASLAGVGILIEKSFQDGRKILEEKNIRVCSLCRIASLEDGKVKFNKADDEL